MRARPAFGRGIDVPYSVGNLLEKEDKKAAEEFAKNARTILQR